MASYDEAMLDLRVPTPNAWLDVVFADFDAFLLDHAACERKASATGMSFVTRYPDRTELVEPMIEFAKEELEHFHIVYREIARRGLRLVADYKDQYVGGLMALQTRDGGDALLLDRFLVAGVVEARGCERLKLVAEALPEADPLRVTYLDLARAEARHHALFFRLARTFFAAERVGERAAHFLEGEAELMERLPLRAAVH